MSNAQAKYTHGSIGGTMLKTAASMVPATVALSGYNIADTFFVSKLGTLPLAAMGFTFPMIMFIGCVYRGLAAGAMTPLSHSVGGNKSSRAAKVASSGFLLILLCGIVIAAAGLLSMKWTFAQFGAEGEVLPMVSAYMSIWYWGNITVSLGMTGNNFLIALGDAKTASALMVGGMLLNILLDPLFIFGLGPFPAMGISGAALATVISQLFSGVTILFILHFRYRLLTAQVFRFRLLKNLWGLIIRFAIPAIIGTLMMPIGNAVITRIVAGFGDDAVAACAAAGRLEMAAFIVPMSLGIALMPMIGQNFGARHYERINQCRRFAMRFAFFFELVMAVIYFFAAPYLAGFFSDDPRVLEIMTLYLRIIPFGFGLMEIHRYCGFIYTGCNKPAATAWLNALRLFGLLVPFSLLAMSFASLPGLFAARLFSDVVAGIVGLWLVRKMTMRLLYFGRDREA